MYFWRAALCFVVLCKNSHTQGLNTTDATASPAHARLGRTAFLSWTLPRPGLREFTVRRLSSKPLFHITNYNQVNVTDRYKSRAAFTGEMNSSGSGVFSFKLYNVDRSDSAEYRCHSEPDGSRVIDCGQMLVVIYIADPYIVAPRTVASDNNVTLTCYVSVKYSNTSTINWSWRQNAVELANKGRHPLTVSKLHGDYYYHKSPLTVSDVGQDGDRGRYTFKAELVGWDVQSDWSEEFTMSTDSRMEEIPNYTQVREGDHAMVAWKMPRYQYEFYIMTPSGDKLMAVDSNNVYILPKYWLRTRMVEVVTSRYTSTYVFRLYNVTLADAGRYSCRIEKSATKIYKMTQCTHDLIVSRHDATGTKPVMTSRNKSTYLSVTSQEPDSKAHETFPSLYGYAALVGILVLVVNVFVFKRRSFCIQCKRSRHEDDGRSNTDVCRGEEHELPWQPDSAGAGQCAPDGVTVQRIHTAAVPCSMMPLPRNENSDRTCDTEEHIYGTVTVMQCHTSSIR